VTFPYVLRAELLKLRRSKVTLVSFIVFSFMVVIVGSFLWMMKNPAVAESIGLLGQKAKLAFGGQPLDWPSFLALVVEIGGMGGLLMCSVIVSFIFGREYAEGTAKNLLALPVPRCQFVLAKIVTATIWFGALTLWLIPVSLVTGLAVGLTGLTGAQLTAATAKLLGLAGMSLCCSAIVAWVAVETRGYFAPMGFSIGTLMVASVFGHTGWGPWVPWSIVGLYSGAAGPVTDIGWGSVAVIAATLIVGTGLVASHEVKADNSQ